MTFTGKARYDCRANKTGAANDENAHDYLLRVGHRDGGRGDSLSTNVGFVLRPFMRGLLRRGRQLYGC
jgi:hypothetical protein